MATTIYSISYPQKAGGGRVLLRPDAVRQELNSGGNLVAGTIQSLTRRIQRAGLGHEGTSTVEQATRRDLKPRTGDFPRVPMPYAA